MLKSSAVKRPSFTVRFLGGRLRRRLYSYFLQRNPVLTSPFFEQITYSTVRKGFAHLQVAQIWVT